MLIPSSLHPCLVDLAIRGQASIVWFPASSLASPTTSWLLPQYVYWFWSLGALGLLGGGGACAGLDVR